jgi:hypothetical protein
LHFSTQIAAACGARATLWQAAAGTKIPIIVPRVTPLFA